ncbi:MAG TPA: PilZ domain-containing protein [Candidatus Dormibacteraeota bacterium]|nr:PilZ domain-containing protein [Candidatus Dormibacteraeota bacterium]
MRSKTISLNQGELPGESTEERRRGKRLYLNFSIEMSGIDHNGQPFIERTKTENISDTGCRIRTDVRLRAGDTVDVRMILPEDVTPSKEEAHKFKVMWVARRTSGWSIGARMLQPGKLWKVTFPVSKKSSEPSAK